MHRKSSVSLTISEIAGELTAHSQTPWLDLGMGPLEREGTQRERKGGKRKPGRKNDGKTK